MKGDDILSVIFLALICIVIAGIVHRLTPAGLMMPSFALMAICLWIAYDYIMIKRHQARDTCKKSQSEEDAEIEKKINKLSDEIADHDSNTKGADDISDDIVNLQPESKNNGEFDIDLYNEQLSIQELHKNMGCTADNRIANRMKYMGMQPKLATDIRSRMNRYTLLPYFEEDCKASEDRDWWDAESDFLDAYM